MELPEPQRSEWRDEVIAGFRAVADVFRSIRDTPPNWERVGAAMDDLDAVIAALDEIRDQEAGE